MWPSSRVQRLSDEALLAAVGMEEPDAAAVLVRRFQRRVYGLALTITLDPSTAEDVSQSVFERAWRHATTYDARRGSVSTWLLTITRNLAIDAMRIRRALPLDPAAIADLFGPDLSHDPLDRVDVRDEIDGMRAALDALPAIQRRAVLLATVGCRTSAEIAEIEGIPIPTAKHRVQVAVRKLREALRSETDA